MTHLFYLRAAGEWQRKCAFLSLFLKSAENNYKIILLCCLFEIIQISLTSPSFPIGKLGFFLPVRVRNWPALLRIYLPRRAILDRFDKTSSRASL